MSLILNIPLYCFFIVYLIKSYTNSNLKPEIGNAYSQNAPGNNF